MPLNRLLIKTLPSRSADSSLRSKTGADSALVLFSFYPREQGKGEIKSRVPTFDSASPKRTGKEGRDLIPMLGRGLNRLIPSYG